jgi:hypothetical protein
MNDSANNWPVVDTHDDGISPKDPGRCYYCKQRIGDLHARDCVMVRMVVRFRRSDGTEVDIDDVPHSWTREDIEKNADFWDLDGAKLLGVVDETPRRRVGNRIATKLVRFRLTVEVDITVPHEWTYGDLRWWIGDEIRRSECFDQVMHALPEAHDRKEDILHTLEYLGVVDETPRRELRDAD